MPNRDSSDTFPALTGAQRYHLEVYGYVVIEDVLNTDEVGRMLEAMQRLKRDFLAAGDLDSAVVRNCNLKPGANPCHLHFCHILETDPAILEYLAHPRAVALAEELVGGAVRLEESEAVMNSLNPESPPPDPARYGFHTGTTHGFGTHTENGLFHCNFVKVLTNLTDLGPDDGGTTVIAGSHKMTLPTGEVIEAAYEDPSLIHSVTAPAGSSLLFPESLIHAAGIIRSDRERCIVIGGYTPPMFQPWPGQEPGDEFLKTVPEHLLPFLTGSESWEWKRHARTSLSGKE